MSIPHARFTARWLLLPLLILSALLIYQFATPPTQVVRGKAAALALTDEMSEEEELAQSLALEDPEVIALSAGTRTEVFRLYPVTTEYTAAASACASEQCWQVNLYNFDKDAAITVLVSTDQSRVLDVLWQPGERPYIPQRLAKRAQEIILAAPEVAEVLGDRPVRDDWAPMHANLTNSPCGGEHLCVASVFDLGDYLLWAFADLHTNEFAGLAWTAVGEDAPDVDRGPEYSDISQYCPPPGTVEQGGWHVEYSVTASDGLAVVNVTYNGGEVLTRAKTVHWHVDYGTSGYQDSTGCGGSGGGFPIYPYPEDVPTRVNQIEDGFEISQDFRMENWGAGCNYRYEQRYQFYNDGRFRVVAGAFGKGCSNNGIYRPLIRIDMAVDGDDGDSVVRWTGSEWEPILTEQVMPALDETFTLNPVSPEGYGWKITNNNGVDDSGPGFYIEPGRGQFADGGRGDNEYFYVVKHHPNEGDTDMGVFGWCCNEPEHGPEQFLNGESVQDTNVVLWYVPQSQTEDTVGNEYCWTWYDPATSSLETVPCFTGPMFIPMEDSRAPALYLPFLSNRE